MKRKLIASILSILMICSICTFNILADTYETYGVLTYERAPFNIYIISCDRSASGTVTIPNEIGGTPVTGIANGAFAGCSNIKSISIPNSVRSIGDSAFSDCISLTAISIPDSVYSLGDWAFYGCDSLTSVYIPNSLSKIGIYTFADCVSLANIVLPDSLYRIKLNAFNNTAYYNNSHNWSNGVLYIGNHLIAAQESITSCQIKSGTVSISAYAFSKCSNLTSITIPDCVRFINEYAFEECSSLSSISIAGNETYIYENAFRNTLYYNNLQNWENGILYITNHLIAAQKSISTCKIKPGTAIIQAYAFNNCTSLTSVYIPESVIFINSGAFYNCTRLTDVYVPNRRWSWSTTIVYDDNQSYMNASEHFLCPTYTFCEKQDSVYQISISCSQAFADGFIFIVIYDANGELINFKQIPCTGESSYQVSLPVVKNAEYAKVFVWENIGGMIPLGDAERVNL